MKDTIRRLSANIRGEVGAIEALAAGMPDDSGIRGAEAVIHLRNAAAELNHAHDCMQIVLAQSIDEKRTK